jgi:hypothetical protein
MVEFIGSRVFFKGSARLDDDDDAAAAIFIFILFKIFYDTLFLCLIICAFDCKR